jgi:hypothetical protein
VTVEGVGVAVFPVTGIPGCGVIVDGEQLTSSKALATNRSIDRFISFLSSIRA